MKAADSKKYVAGWGIVVAAIATAIIGLVRDSGVAVMGGILCAISGWGILSEAKVKKETPPDLPWVRWYHLTAVVVLVGAAVFRMWRSIVR